MAIICRHIIWGVLSVLLLAPGHAQQRPVSVPQIELRFTVFGIQALQGLAFLPGVSAKPVALKFYNNYRSPLYSYKGERTLAFYDEVELGAAMERAASMPRSPSVEAPPLNVQPVAVCSIPEGVTKAFLLFFNKPAPSEDGIKYEIFVMDDGEINVPAGSFLIINASGLEFAAKINSQVVKIDRGVSAPFRAEDGRVSLKLARLDPGYQNLMLGDQWKLDERHKTILVLFPITSSTNLLPDARRLTERLPADPKTAKIPFEERKIE
jgi:hypothetical protein